ncbi:MAG: rRNA methyltransferase, partial [Proteobacteria bacterium]|nr:rRNA methyltransferase [Pseudomonadota bacterium]
ESAHRLEMNISTEVHDWEKGPLKSQDKTLFDAVLLDAPCSGLGTVRRHPEIRWRRQENDLEKMALRQLAILRHVAPAVRRGGALVYTVCSPEPEEGVEVVQAFLANNEDFFEVERRCTAPPEGNEDAHFGVRLERR